MLSNFSAIQKLVKESLVIQSENSFKISNFKSEFRLTDEELQYLLLIEFNNQQKNQKLYYAFYKASPIPQINNGKVLTVIGFAVLGFFAAPLLGIGAITGVLIGAALGWRLSGGAKKPEQTKTKTQKQERIVSTPGFDSAPQPPQVGGVIPLIFTNTDVNTSGGVRINGNVINSYVRTYQNKQILYTLVALGLGEIVQIDNSQLLIDNQPLENFYDNVVTVNTVNGQENQPGFYNYPWYSQVISPNNNNTFGLSYRGSVIFGSVNINTFRVEESDYDNFNSTERYRVNGLDFRVINKYIDGTNYYIVTNRTFVTFNNDDRKIYATFRTKYKTVSKCTRLELNFAFDISARDKTSNEATTFALVFDVFLDGRFIRRFYETNKKEGTIRRTLFLTNLTYKKHLIETYSHGALDNFSPVRLDDSGIYWTIPTGVFDEGKEVILVAGSNPNNQQSAAKVNDYLNVDTKSSMSSDRGANAKLTTVNEITYPIDLGHPNMTNYRNIALQDIAIEATDNIQSSPATSTLVKKGIKYRNHIAAGEASINSQNNFLIANGVNISEVQAGYVCRNISRQTESLITNISGSTIITQTSLNWEPGEAFLIYFEGAINYFPDIFVYTRLNKKGGVRGLSISEKFIDYPSICSARRFCKSSRLFWDGVIDQPTKWNSWVLQESLGSLLYPFKYSGNYGLRQEEVSNPVDIFNSARIFPGTFSQNKPDNTKINCVQLTYSDNEENFTKRDRTITVMTADAFYNREVLQIENLNFESITDLVQAKRVAARFLKSRILQNKVIEFTTGLSGFNCREGDLIIVQYALTELESEVSGFCLTAQNFTNGSQEITLSKAVSEDLNNQGYTASIYHLESGTVQTSKAFSVLLSGNLLITGLSEPIKPAREKFNGDVVVINKNISEKIYRISTIKPENYGVKIIAVNWSAQIHVDADLFFID
jgi:hypothetical protein